MSWQNETKLRFALKGIRPGQIPAMCEAVGLRVLGIKRIRIGRCRWPRCLKGSGATCSPGKSSDYAHPRATKTIAASACHDCARGTFHFKQTLLIGC